MNKISNRFQLTPKLLNRSNIPINFQVKGTTIQVRTETSGEFQLMLLPGMHTLEIFSSGHQPLEHTLAVDDYKGPTTVDLTLPPDAGMTRAQCYKTFTAVIY